jgi:transcriptional regulator with XRE-family HTH domain
MKNKLRKVLKEKSISTRKIAIDLQVTDATVNNWCKAKSLDIKTIYKICNYLELPISDVFLLDNYEREISFDIDYDKLNNFK